MGEWEDLIERLREEGLEDEAKTAEKYSAGQLREKAKRVDVAERERDEAKAEIAVLKAAPKRASALEKVGVDVKSLRPAERELIESAKVDEGKDYDEEWAKNLVEKYQLPVTTGGNEEEETPPPATPFGQPGGPAGATGKGPVGKMTLKPEEVNSWDASKRMRFYEWCQANKSDAFERLLQGETVTGLAFE